MFQISYCWDLFKTFERAPVFCAKMDSELFCHLLNYYFSFFALILTNMQRHPERPLVVANDSVGHEGPGAGSPSPCG